MDEKSEMAARALFEGNYDEVFRLLNGRVRANQAPVCDVWMLSFAVEDPEERQYLLRQVSQSRENPYAQLAAEILQREADFQKQIAAAPPLQAWFLRQRQRLIYFIVTVVILAGAGLIVLLLFTPPEEPAAVVAERTSIASTQAAIHATETIVALTPTITPTATEARGGRADYPPVGNLEIISWGFPTNLPIGRGTSLQSAPNGTSYVAIQFEFRCGAGFSNNAFCENVPQAESIQLRLNDGSLVNWDGQHVIGEQATGIVGVGQAFRGWLAFPVPNGRSPEALVLNVFTQPEQENPLVFEAPLRR